MGQNFALNMASHGFKIIVASNTSPDNVDSTLSQATAEGNLPLTGAKTPKEFIEGIAKPRKVMLFVDSSSDNNKKAVDETIATLTEFMEAGDMIIDCGNEWYLNSIRRSQEVAAKEIMFIGMGIGGGENAARNGPSLMPGGPRAAYDAIEPILKRCAAQADDGPCTAYLGPIGAGDYVNMVHNGIEHSDMQLLAEVYDVLKSIVKMSNPGISATLAAWNNSELASYLIEISADIFSKKDDLAPEGGDANNSSSSSSSASGEDYVVDKVLDKTEMKGSNKGKWSVQEAAERGVDAPTISASLGARMQSARKDERTAASSILRGPSDIPSVSHEQIIEDLKAALYCSKVCSYAQGMSVIKSASEDEKWEVSLSECARIWKGGTTIRAKLLDRIRAAFANDSNLPNLMIDPDFAAELNSRHNAWRRIVTLCIASGIACPALCASLGYYDTYRRRVLPSNLIQAQRDYFGGEAYERTDRKGSFHCAWTAAHKDVISKRSASAGESAAK